VEERDRLAYMLQGKPVSVLVVTGPQGCGKTAFPRQAARARQPYTFLIDCRLEDSTTPEAFSNQVTKTVAVSCVDELFSAVCVYLTGKPASKEDLAQLKSGGIDANELVKAFQKDGTFTPIGIVTSLLL
jgi:hypothetical protein